MSVGLLYVFFVLFLVWIIMLSFFFFNDTATTEIYTLSLHDALPISARPAPATCWSPGPARCARRSEEHTSELQSHVNLVCRLLLEKKNTKQNSLKDKENNKTAFIMPINSKKK